MSTIAAFRSSAANAPGRTQAGTPAADRLIREFKAGEAGVNAICPACSFHVALGTDCPGCGVYAGEPCADCDQPMYHDRSCPALSAS